MRVWLFSLALLLAPGLGASEATLIEFRIEDQFKNKHTHEEYAGAVVLLIGADGEGAGFNDAWSTAIHDAVKTHPNYASLARMPYADLRGVPFFAKGYVRGLMPEDADNWVLLDWRGDVAKAYEFVKGKSNVLVFDSTGALAIQAAGEGPDQEVVDGIVEVIRGLLDDM